MSTHVPSAALTAFAADADRHRPAPARSPGRRWLTTAGWAAAAQVVVALLILKLYVATHPDTAVGARGMLLGIGTALFAVALVTIIAGLCLRPLLDLLAEMRRDRRGSAEVAQLRGENAALRGEIAALRGEQAATRDQLQRLVDTIAPCATRLASLPEDVAEQIRPLANRVTLLEETVEDGASAESIVARAIGAGGSVTSLRAHNGRHPGAG